MPITSNFFFIPCLSEQKLRCGKAVLPQPVFTMRFPNTLSNMQLTDALYNMRTRSKHGHLICDCYAAMFQSVMHTVR